MKEKIKVIKHGGRMIATIIKSSFYKHGIEFFTPPDFSQQLAYMNRPKGYSIQPHIHNKIKRRVYLTQEVLFIKSGRVRINFFTEKRKFLRSAILSAGDVILLASGGHGFTMLEPTEMVEVKQGPYTGDRDKIRFEPARKWI